MTTTASGPARTPQAVMSPGLIAVCLGYFMVILDSTIVNVALPALRADLGASGAGLEWVVDGYLLMLAALLLTGGVLADRYGARRVFGSGLGVFLFASAGCGLAPDVAVLVVARLVQGVGAALTVPSSLALLRASFPDVSDRARAIGAWGGIAGLAAASGPILGGALVTAASWRLVFFVNLPIGLAALGLTLRYVAAPPPQPRVLDSAAQVLGVLALAALTFALIEGGDSGVTALVVAAIVVFAVTLAGFIVVEQRSAEPMLALGLFRDRTFAGGNAVGLLINLGFYGELFVINLYFQQVEGYSALAAGLALLPQMGVVAAGSALSGRFTARAGGPRPTMLIGLVVGGAGLFGLLAATADSPYGLLVVPLIATGFGMSFTMPAATTAVVEAVPAERAGLASGTINAARQVGGVIGVAVLGALVTGHGDGSDFVTGLRIALGIAGAAFLSGAALTAMAVHDGGQQRRSTA
jgi:DHA2 family methylenomycin A resistance protein-like MFS transporter